MQTTTFKEDNEVLYIPQSLNKTMRYVPKKFRENMPYEYHVLAKGSM